ncbi:MAG: hypothetical protein UX59_C0024G0020 [Microgenomates group bacterium GW2011_GWA1_46_7]|nr:MAG: hypothetical protein UX59_C0024G0020 [Microgenomates group bacterium GW2011_GWA1_46_7]
MAGAAFLAVSNKSRTRDAPTPTNISINSLPAIEKNETPASPATALAIKVFPTPAGPTSNTPLGVRAPTFLYFSGFFKKSTTSTSSALASSTPATSSNLTFCLPLANNLALDLPIPNIPPPPAPPFPPRICLKIITKNNAINTNDKIFRILPSLSKNDPLAISKFTVLGSISY